MKLNFAQKVMFFVCLWCMFAFQVFGNEQCDGAFSNSEKNSARLTPTVRAVRRAIPWVVNIGTERVVQINDPYELLFSKFFQPNYRMAAPVKKYFPLGSGVLVDENGLILTNYHVVQRANNIEVRLWNGQAYPAVIVGFDQPNDLCLLRLTENCEPGPLSAAVLARPNDLFLGETVITIGNPFGLEHSVSQGVLSAFNRSLTENGVQFSDILQTDAAINPGNSGGPLINLDGELIGINLAIREDAEGIGFAIPLARIEQFLATWLRPEHFGDTYLGLDDSAQGDMKFENGVVVPPLKAGSPLAVAGVEAGNVVVKIGDTPIRRLTDFGRRIYRLKAGETVEFLMKDGKRCAVTATGLSDIQLVATRMGLEMQTLTRQLGKAMGIPEQIQGLVISEVIPQAAFATQNLVWRDVLKRGDVIMQFNGQDLHDVGELAGFLRKTRSGEKATILAITFNQVRRTYRPLSIEIILN